MRKPWNGGFAMKIVVLDRPLEKPGELLRGCVRGHVRASLLWCASLKYSFLYSILKKISTDFIL
jgi:hypothetical protein